jgi:glycosyltransferase involved in cell wall biosynthesis
MTEYLGNQSKPTGKFGGSISLLCWAYNEENSILEFLERASQLMEAAVEDYEIILIEDGSTDRTYQFAAEFQKQNENLKVFRNEKNLNVGISSQRAIMRASKKYCFWQTVDWSYDISNLRIFLEYLRTHDIVQGVRRKPVRVKVKLFKPFVALLKLFGMKHLTRRSDTVAKAIISLFNYILIRGLFRIPLSDFQNVTFYPRSWIQSLTFESKSSFSSPEMLLKSYWNGMSIKEVPIDFIPRAKGEAKGTKLGAIVHSVKDIFRLWFIWIILGERKFVKKGKIDRLNPLEWE